jgi:hypothetical protein
MMSSRIGDVYELRFQLATVVSTAVPNNEFQQRETPCGGDEAIQEQAV